MPIDLAVHKGKIPIVIKRNQMNLKRKIMILMKLKQVQKNVKQPSLLCLNVAKENAQECHEPDEYYSQYYAEDDHTGVELDAAGVAKARSDEVAYIRNSNLHTKVPIEKCIKRTGKQPIAVKWIDINSPNSCLTAMGFLRILHTLAVVGFPVDIFVTISFISIHFPSSDGSSFY